MTIKSRRITLTLECVTTYTLAEIRASLTHVALSHGRWITRYPDNEDDGMPNRIVQVQVGAIKPVSKADMLPSEQERRDARAKLAKKFADEVSKWPAKKLRACFAQPEIVAAAEERERKARRAKGAK